VDEFVTQAIECPSIRNMLEGRIWRTVEYEVSKSWRTHSGFYAVIRQKKTIVQIAHFYGSTFNFNEYVKRNIRVIAQSETF
jgi:hypothetical protein